MTQSKISYLWLKEKLPDYLDTWGTRSVTTSTCISVKIKRSWPLIHLEQFKGIWLNTTNDWIILIFTESQHRWKIQEHRYPPPPSRAPAPDKPELHAAVTCSILPPSASSPSFSHFPTLLLNVSLDHLPNLCLRGLLHSFIHSFLI